jgi:hypothetical protein
MIGLFRIRASRIHAIAFAAFAVLAPGIAHAQAVIKVNDSVSVRLGFLAQMWGDFNQNVRQDSSYAQNLFIRRLRFIMGGQVGSKVNFFLDTDSPNLGRVTTTAGKALAQSVIVQDAWVEVKPGTTNALLLTAGLQYVPLCRNCIQTAVSHLVLDFDSYAFAASAVTGSSNGRDVGLQAKGYLADNRIEYRAGVFSGARGVTSGGAFTASNALRGAGRIQVQLLEPEAPGYAYAGTYFGKKKVLAIGAGYDAQSSYKAWAADAFFSYPLGNNGITAQTNFIHYDGGTFFPSSATVAGLPKQNTFEIEGGYHFTDAKFTPFAKFESRNVDDALATNAANLDEHRIQLGGTYCISGNNLNVKAAYTRGTLDRLPAGSDALAQNGFTIQFQAYSY